MKLVIYLITFLISLQIQAQTLPEAGEFVAGDKIIYKTKVLGKSSRYEFVFTEVGRTHVKGDVSIDAKQMEFESPAHGYLGKEFCLADVTECEWYPAVKLFDKNTKPGEKWTAIVNIKLKTNTIVDEEIEFRAESYEKVKVIAGEFETIRVVATRTIKAKLEKGDIYNGTFKMTTWFGVADNRLALIKREYKNSFKQAFSQELEKISKISN